MKSSDQQIRSFMKIAELRSITSAAEALDLSQSGLSKQLHQLEEFLGQSLFNRNGRGVSLTGTGEKLYTAAATAFGALEHTLAKLKNTEGALRIATADTLSTYFIPGLLGAFLAQRPHIKVHAEYRTYTAQAICAGVFGSPSYVVDGELFWGQDQLDFLDRKLAAS